MLQQGKFVADVLYLYGENTNITWQFRVKLPTIPGYEFDFCNSSALQLMLVKNGKIVAPANVMRFDDTLYRMLGDNLDALTRERELLLESSTYGSRVLTSVTLPGALVSQMNFTL